MAVSAPTLGYSISGTGSKTGATTSAAFTPGADCLLIVTASHEDWADGGAPGHDLDISDSEGLTWTVRTPIQTIAGAWGGLHKVWTAPVGGSPVSMTVTLTPDDGSWNHSAGFKVYWVTGHNISDPIVQVNNSSAISPPSGGDSETHTHTLATDATTGNRVLAMFHAQNDGSGVFADIANFAEFDNLSGNGIHSVVYHRDDMTDDAIACTDLGQQVWWVFATGMEIAPASGTNYDETGLGFTVTATIGESDTADFSDSTAFTINSTISTTDTANLADSTAFTINATIGITELALQPLIPDGDQTVGSWTPTPLWSRLDEDAPGDGLTVTETI